MKTIGIKLADGSFFPVLQEGEPDQKKLELTTAHNNQTRVMVDLYRSAESSMDDAEYVDTLQIDNINEHPRGDASISFTVAIDENNELSAKIVDSETGATSKTTIELVNRTLEERMADEPSDYDISETSVPEDEVNSEAFDFTQPEETFAENEQITEENLNQASEENELDKTAGVVGGGLLAAAMLLNKNEAEESPEMSVDYEAFSETDDSIEITGTDEFAGIDESDVIAGTEGFSESTETATFEEITESGEPADSFESTGFEESLPDFDFSESETTQEILEENLPDQTPEQTIEASESADFPDFTFDENQTAENTFDEIPVSAETSEDDFNFNETFNENIEIEENSEFSENAEISTDFPFEESSESFSTETSDEMIDAPFETNDYELPDFIEEKSNETENETEQENETSSLFDLPDFTEDSSVETNSQDESMDWDFDEELTRAENTNYSDDSTGSSGLSFTGLYDKETELGTSSDDDEDDDCKKRKTSVLICIVCAIICIIAVLLILFVIPSKLNVLKKGQTQENVLVVEEVVVEPEIVPEPEPEPVIPSAKEDEIVIIEEAEEVKPEPPAPPKEEPKPDIIYKIKWGDTLWDIADTYYKNPWRYKKIARYNGIKDPDYIVSGTRIRIPQE